MTNPNTPNSQHETGDLTERDAIEGVLKEIVEIQEDVIATIASYNSIVTKADRMKHKAQTERDRKIEKVIIEKEREGWQKFIFESEYNGSHRERGYEDIYTVYIFAPGVDFSQWKDVEFSHGTHSQNRVNDEFEEWLDTVPKDQYIEIPY